MVGREHLLGGQRPQSCSFPGGSHGREGSRAGQLFLEVRLTLSHCFAWLRGWRKIPKKIPYSDDKVQHCFILSLMETTCFPPDTFWVHRLSVTMCWKEKIHFHFWLMQIVLTYLARTSHCVPHHSFAFPFMTRSWFYLGGNVPGFRWHHLASLAALCAHPTDPFPMRCKERVVWDFWEFLYKSVSGHLSYNVAGASAVILGRWDALNGGMYRGGAEREKKPGSLVITVPALPAWLWISFTWEKKTFRS